MDQPTPWRRRDPQPYEPGNLAAVKHGAYSERIVNERALDVLRRLQETDDCKWLADVDAVQLDTWLKARARYELLDEGIWRVAGERGIEEVPDRLLRSMTAQERNLMSLTQDLGLDPTGRARLLKDLGLAKQFMREGAQRLAEKGSEIRRLRALEAKGSKPKR